MAQYLKPDCELGYVEDSAEIESAKINNLRHSILGCMLGDYDETGAYVIDSQIIQELIEMPKYIVEVMDNIEVCKSCLKLDKQISFLVTFEGNKATLSLIEKLSYEANFAINSGSYSNINEFVLDTVETSGEINRNTIYTRWNIGSFGGEVVDIFNCGEEILEKYFGIVNRFKYLLQANRVMLEKEEEIEEAEATYSIEIFEILTRYPKLKEAVEKQIKQTLNEKKDMLSVKKPNFAKTFNEILDNALESNINQLNEKDKLEFAKEKHNATTSLNINRVDIIDLKHNAKGEMSPSVIELDTHSNYESRPINDLGEDFVSVNQKLLNILAVDSVFKSKNKNRLRAMIVGLGLAEAIGVVVEKPIEQAEIIIAPSTGNAKPQENKPKKVAASSSPQKSKASSSKGKAGPSKNKSAPIKNKPAKTVPEIAKNKRDKTKDDGRGLLWSMVTGQDVTRATDAIDNTTEMENPLDEEIINKYNVEESYLDLVARAKLAVIATEETKSNDNNGIETETLQKSKNNILDISANVKVHKQVLVEEVEEFGLGK